MIPNYIVVICLVPNTFPWAKPILIWLLFPSGSYPYWTSFIVEFNLFPGFFLLFAQMYC